MYQFVCEHLVPGCEFKAQKVSEEEAHDVAKDHLHERHQVEYVDDNAWEMIARAVMPIPHWMPPNAKRGTPNAVLPYDGCREQWNRACSR